MCIYIYIYIYIERERERERERDSYNHYHYQDIEHFPKVSFMLFLCPHILSLIPATSTI